MIVSLFLVEVTLLFFEKIVNSLFRFAPIIFSIFKITLSKLICFQIAFMPAALIVANAKVNNSCAHRGKRNDNPRNATYICFNGCCAHRKPGGQRENSQQKANEEAYVNRFTYRIFFTESAKTIRLFSCKAVNLCKLFLIKQLFHRN